MRRWLPMFALAMAQFVMVLDTTVMNVSIDDVITDLDTSVSSMQIAITTYTLVMAALMLVGGKLGDIIGRRLAFQIGLVVFGAGALTTALSPNIEVLIVGWSITEGTGAALIIPAVAALLAGNYTGRDRAIAFGIIGGTAGAAAAAGPIIGGWVATEFSWRWVFGGEVAIMAALLACSGVIRDSKHTGERPKLDGLGAILSVAGLALVVLGTAQATSWGWIEPKQALTLFGTEITPFGFSIVPFVILAGLGLIGLFVLWEEKLRGRGGQPLLRVSMLQIPSMRAGLQAKLMQQLCLAGAFFALPLYLQIVLGYDPLQTGIRILPLSIAVFVVALGAAPLSSRFAPKRIVQVGTVLMLIGICLILGTIEPTLKEFEFMAAMAVFGVGLGLGLSQIGNVILSSVSTKESSEAGGLQGTAQNLGAALGTALIGSVLLTGLLGAFDNRIQASPDIPSSTRTEITQKTSQGIPFVPASTVESALKSNNVPEATAKEITDDYADAQLTALKTALGAVGVLIALSLWTTRRLPSEPLSVDDSPPAAAT